MFNQPLQTSPSVADRSTGGGVMLNNFAGYVVFPVTTGLA